MFTLPRSLPSQITHPVVAVLHRLGVTPNMLTVAQLIGGFIAAWLIASGELVWGGIAVLAAATLDAFDGTLARMTGQATRFGAVFDSVIDRLFEGAVLGGVLYYYLDQGAKLESMLTFATVVGSLCVSYVRSRAETEGIKMYEGFFPRVVRIVVLSAGLVLGLLTEVLWVLAVMTLFTTFQRLAIVWLRLREEAKVMEEDPKKKLTPLEEERARLREALKDILVEPEPFFETEEERKRREEVMASLPVLDPPLSQTLIEERRSYRY